VFEGAAIDRHAAAVCCLHILCSVITGDGRLIGCQVGKYFVWVIGMGHASVRIHSALVVVVVQVQCGKWSTSFLAAPSSEEEPPFPTTYAVSLKREKPLGTAG
jgi:hypothetical protein